MKRRSQIYNDKPRHLERLIITGIAITAVFSFVFVKALLFGEFAWLASR